MEKPRPIETAPQDGTRIIGHIPGYGDGVIYWIDGLLDDNQQDCGGWAWMDMSPPPPSWTDGICWERNEDDEPSVKPTHWLPT
jgi:hypothetical protein